MMTIILAIGVNVEVLIIAWLLQRFEWLALLIITIPVLIVICAQAIKDLKVLKELK
jgi:hypothetical protein